MILDKGVKDQGVGCRSENSDSDYCVLEIELDGDGQLPCGIE